MSGIHIVVPSKSSSMPTASVVIPTYNREENIIYAINSVLHQTFDDYEILVIDDSSTDDTVDAVRQIDDSRIQLHTHLRNKGGSAARNTGIEQADGEYIAFLDSDDEWLPSKLEQQINCLRSRSDDWVGVYCDYEVQRHGLTKTLRKFLYKILFNSQRQTGRKEGGDKLIKNLLMMQIPIGGASSLLVKTNAIQELRGFDPKFQRHQDWEFLIRLLSIGKLAYVDDKLVTKHETSPPPAAVAEQSKKKYFKKFNEEIAAMEKSGYNVAAQHQFDLSCMFFREGNISKGVDYLKMVPPENQEIIRLARSMLSGLRQ